MSDPASRAIRAQQLLDDPILRELLDEAKNNCLSQLAHVDPTNDKALQSIALSFQGFCRVEQALQSIVTSGKQAARPQSGIA